MSDSTTNKKIEFFYHTTGDIPKWDSNINLKNIKVISDKNKKNILIDKIHCGKDAILIKSINNKIYYEN